MRALGFSLLFVVAPILAAAAPASSAKKDPKPVRPAFGKKSYGLLLLGPGGGSEWQESVGRLRKEIKDRVPFQAMAGPLDSRALQRSIDSLQSLRVDKIVVVALYLDSGSEDVDQLRYLLGMSQFPSEEYLAKWGIAPRNPMPQYRADPARQKMLANAGMLPQGAIARVKAKTPVVLVGGGLDVDACVSQTLLERTRGLSRDPKGEAVILLGVESGNDERDARRRKTMDSLAHQIKVGGGFKLVRAMLLPPASSSKPPGPKENYPRSTDKDRLWPKSGRVWEEQGAEDKVRAAIRGISVRSKVIILPYLLERDGSERLWRKKLDNLFFQWKGQALLPSKPIEDWVLQRAAEGEKLKDMVEFKDPGQNAGPSNGRK